MMRSVRSGGFEVTVVRRGLHEDLQSAWLDDPETGRCEMFATGENRRIERGAVCPDGFCRKAWRVIVDAVNEAEMCSKGRDGVMLVSCPDGSRPVVFKIETL